jgi:hypothetical protein
MKLTADYTDFTDAGETPGLPTGWINGVGLRAAYDF